MTRQEVLKLAFERDPFVEVDQIDALIASVGLKAAYAQIMRGHKAYDPHSTGQKASSGSSFYGRKLRSGSTLAGSKENDGADFWGGRRLKAGSEDYSTRAKDFYGGRALSTDPSMNISNSIGALSDALQCPESILTALLRQFGDVATLAILRNAAGIAGIKVSYEVTTNG